MSQCSDAMQRSESTMPAVQIDHKRLKGVLYPELRQAVQLGHTAGAAADAHVPTLRAARTRALCCAGGGDCAGPDGGDELAFPAGAREDADGGLGADRVRRASRDAERPPAARVRASTQGEEAGRTYRRAVDFLGCTVGHIPAPHEGQNSLRLSCRVHSALNSIWTSR